jgi:hypothetical protein
VTAESKGSDLTPYSPRCARPRHGCDLRYRRGPAGTPGNEQPETGTALPARTACDHGIRALGRERGHRPAEVSVYALPRLLNSYWFMLCRGQSYAEFADRATVPLGGIRQSGHAPGSPKRCQAMRRRSSAWRGSMRASAAPAAWAKSCATAARFRLWAFSIRTPAYREICVDRLSAVPDALMEYVDSFTIDLITY